MEIGTGATITFSSSFFAKIKNINWTGIERPAIDTTNMGTTTARTYVPGDLYDAGELEVEMLLAAETAAPITGAAETVTVTLPSEGAGSTSTWVASGFLTGFQWGAPLEEMQTATATIKFSGAITVTA